ncbi:MAG: DUF1211 domain-containing protein [Ferruginibacter sp.]|nr:DUF1211 domain-containing protein [Rhodoferax sp.]
MKTTRLEAFSDGVIAIILTIMVLEMKVPHGTDWADLRPLLPVFLSYVLSFVNVGIYWNNHHHLLHAADKLDGSVLWANNHLLFWLSLVPFTTGWMGENHFAALPVAVYAFNLMLCAFAFVVLQAKIVRVHGDAGVLAQALGPDTKGKVSLVFYFLSIPLALLGYRLLAGCLIIGVAAMWFLPDRRIEKVIAE